MRKCRIGTCELGCLPRTAAIVDDFLPMREVAAIKKIGADLLEIRVDGFSKDIDTICDYILRIKKTIRLPLIGTIRENKWTKGNRPFLFSKILPLVDAIDVEIDAPEIKRIIALAGEKTVIVSEHDFVKTPGDAALGRIATKAAGLGCDIVKIAAMAQCREDVIRLLEFTRSCAIPIVAFSMGEIGAVSRVMSMLFGSLYSYGFIKKANAPGQIHLRTLVEDVRRYFPELRHRSTMHGCG
jgi:3-dehydroquinate dehydratase I